jgi:hypothetical protein
MQLTGLGIKEQANLNKPEQEARQTIPVPEFQLRTRLSL